MTRARSLCTFLAAPLLACWVPAVAGVGCCGGGGSGAYSAGHFTDAHVSYRVGAPGTGWAEVSQPKANVAWFHPGHDAVILVNSSCEGVADSPLEGLTNDLLMGTTERAVLEQNRLAFSGREALETRARAKLDGVMRDMKLFVLKKDGCVYDVVFGAPAASFDAAEGGYARVKDGFVVDARRDR